MAALQPTPFSFPPIRYSPIQEAFRGALDYAMQQAFAQPFLKKAQQRELSTFAQERGIERAQEITYLPIKERVELQSKINLGQLIPESQIGLAPDQLQRAKVAERATLGGVKYYDPADVANAKNYFLPADKPAVDWLTQVAGRIGMKLDPKQITKGNFEDFAKEAGVGIQAADYQERQREFNLTKDQLMLQGLQAPGEGVELLAKTRNYRETDPLTHQYTGRSRALTAEEATLISQIPKLRAALLMPPTQLSAANRTWVQGQLDKATELQGHLGFSAQVGVDVPTAHQDLGKMLTGPHMNIAENQDLARATAQAVRLQMLFNEQTRLVVKPKEDQPLMGISGIEMAFMQGNRPLTEAMYALQWYPTLEAFEDAARNGLWVPTGPARDLLIKAYARQQVVGNGVWHGGRNSLDTRLPADMSGMGANAPKSPQEAAGVAAATLPPWEVAPAVTGQAAPNVDYQGTDMQRGVYQTVFSKLKADSMAWPTIKAVADSAFNGGLENAVNYFRALANDPNSTVPEEQRQAAILYLNQLERLPQSQQRAALSRLQLNFMQAASAAREAALNIPTTMLPEAKKELTGKEPGAGKAAEKKPAGQEKKK